MDEHIVEREARVHGKLWGTYYQGYFSDKRAAKDYVAAIIRVAHEFKPSAIVDLGGGTGFILEQLVEAGIADDIRLVNMDASDAQLAMCNHPRLTPWKGTIQSLQRADIVAETGSLMLICRSVLHYGGIARQKPWLTHLRDQMKPGEWFVHQSGCSDDIEAALALDVLFEMMGVDKWVPPRGLFLGLLAEAKIQVTDDFPMPPLIMPSDDMALRYGLTSDSLDTIKAGLLRTCANRPDLFKPTPSGFTFNFPYRVFACKAIT
jgi:hypothetical protein